MTSKLEIWTSREWVQALGISPDHWGAIARDEESPVPPHFGMAGNSRLWDADVARAAIPAIREWIANTQTRSRARQWAELRRREEEFKQRAAELMKPPPVWADPRADAARLRRPPPGFMAAEEAPPKKPVGRVGKPTGRDGWM